MSLLYECISGIIQGGILEAIEGTAEGEEIAKLCVGKLRGMMVIEGDSNCKLTANLIIISHSVLINYSKIRCATRFREDRWLASIPGWSAARRNIGVHR
jgi:hypothetical protein